MLDIVGDLEILAAGMGGGLFVSGAVIMPWETGVTTKKSAAIAAAGLALGFAASVALNYHDPAPLAPSSVSAPVKGPSLQAG